jgi:hypothetical protein
MINIKKLSNRLDFHQLSHNELGRLKDLFEDYLANKKSLNITHLQID